MATGSPDVQVEFEEFLSLTTAWISHDHRDAITMDAGSSVSEALNILSGYNILSVVVTENNEPIGFLSVLDILSLVALLMYPIDAEPGDAVGLDSVQEKLKMPVKDLLGLHRESAHLFVYDGTTEIATVLDAMSRGVHRVLVKCSSGDNVFYRVISQTNICKQFFRYSQPLFQSTLLKSVKQLGYPKAGKEVVTAKTDDSVLTVLRLMEKNELYAIPLVDEDDAIVSNFSAADLRTLRPSDFLELDSIPIIDFLKRRRGGRVRTPVTCTDASEMFFVLSRAIASKVHRVWIVTQEKRVVGVLSLSDMIDSILRQQQFH